MEAESLSKYEKQINLLKIFPLEKMRIYLHTKQRKVLKSKIVFAKKFEV